ncbi:EamA family transporter [Thermoproteota archaeon]
MEWYVLVLVCAFLFGIAEVIKKKILNHEHTLQFTATYHTVAFVMILVLLPKVNFTISILSWGLILLKSVLLAIAAYIFLKMLRHYEISEIEPLKNLSPMFLLVLGFLILNEKPSIVNLSGIGLLIVGTYMLEVDHKAIDLKKPLKIFREKNVLLFLVFLVFISFCAIIDRYVIYTIGSVDIYTYYFLTMMFIAVLSITVELIKKKNLREMRRALKKDWIPLIIAALLTILSDLLYFEAIFMPAALIVLVIPIKRLSTLVSAFVGGELFHEHGLKIRLISCAVMIVGASLVIL